jgi:ABC-type glycerol-3-phosphate transport system substrate-binding protein
MKIALGILAVCYGLTLAACDGGMASSPSTCLKDGSVSWWVEPNKEGQVKDTATMQNCAATNSAWQQPAK